MPFASFYISKFNCESEKPALLALSTSHPAIHLMTLGVEGWRRGSLTKIATSDDRASKFAAPPPIGDF